MDSFMPFGLLILVIISMTPSSPVGTSLYLSTNAATPIPLSHLATSLPSLLIESAWNPPPGQIMTDAPVAIAGSGSHAVSVGRETLVTTCVFQILEKYSFSLCVQDSEPGADPEYRGITFCACAVIDRQISDGIKLKKNRGFTNFDFMLVSFD